MDTSEQPSDQKGTFSRFFENPTVRIIERVLAFLSIPLGIYITIATQQYRQLSCTISPTKAIIVKSGQSSNLSVTYNGKEITTDVTAIQVAFWNAGNQSIKRGDVLKPLVINTTPILPILESQIRKVRRDVSGIKLDESKIAEGEITIKWDILEKDDGGIVQLMVAGVPETPIEIKAVIEGQKELSMIKKLPKIGVDHRVGHFRPLRIMV